MEQENSGTHANARLKTRRRTATAVLLAGMCIAGIVGIYYWHRARIYVKTDDAYIHGHIHTISARVAGTVTEVLVADNELVKEGQVIVKLDPQPFAAIVRDAAAALALAENEVAQMKASVQAAEANLAHARATLRQAELDLRRIESLVADGVGSKEALDKAITAREVARANVAAATEELHKARAALGNDSGDGIHPLILKRRAELEQAELNLGYTTIRSPARGHVTRKSVEAGNRIQPGQPFLFIVPLEDLWVVANYKETQLERVRPGQPAEIEVDTYPGLKLKGRVDSIMVGTGAVFSLFPPENATGNFVKVVQRIPVKIVLEQRPNPTRVLRVGMSVVPTIDTTVSPDAEATHTD